MIQAGKLFRVQYRTIAKQSHETVDEATVYAIAANELVAEITVCKFVRKHTPDYRRLYKGVDVLDIQHLFTYADQQPLLVLIGGTSEADVVMKSPMEKFPPGLVIVRQSEHVLEIAYIKRWLNSLHWTGFRWHEQRGCWIRIFSANASEIVGEALSVAVGHLRLVAQKAMQNLPKG